MNDALDEKLTLVKERMSKKTRQRVFLEAYAEHANVLASARAAGISRQAVYKWLEYDEDFSFAYNQAKEDAKDVLRAEIYRRAVEGWEEPVYQLGKYAGKVRKFDATLLIFQAKMLMPEYREKQPDMGMGVNTTNAGVIPIDTKNLTNEELQLLKQIALNQKAREQA